jgi:hypothetical protein
MVLILGISLAVALLLRFGGGKTPAGENRQTLQSLMATGE